MIDPISATLSALTAHSPAAIILVFLAGLATSLGPCVAPRYLAVAAVAGTHRRPLVPISAFIGGLTAAFMAIGFTAGALGALWSISSTVYALMGLALVAGGTIMLVRAVPGPGSHHEHRETHPGAAAVGPNRSLGGIFLLGAASALVISPCCTPVVAAIVATSTAIGQPVLGALLLLSYALGHSLPLLLAATLRQLTGYAARVRLPVQASAIVSAVLMLALGFYLAVQA